MQRLCRLGSGFAFSCLVMCHNTASSYRSLPIVSRPGLLTIPIKPSFFLSVLVLGLYDRFQHVGDIFWPDGLRHEEVEAMLIGFCSRDVVAQSRDGNDHSRVCACLLLELAYLPSSFKAVHDRHIQIEQHDVWSSVCDVRKYLVSRLRWLAPIFPRDVDIYGFLAVSRE